MLALDIPVDMCRHHGGTYGATVPMLWKWFLCGGCVPHWCLLAFCQLTVPAKLFHPASTMVAHSVDMTSFDLSILRINIRFVRLWEFCNYFAAFIFWKKILIIALSLVCSYFLFSHVQKVFSLFGDTFSCLWHSHILGFLNNPFVKIYAYFIFNNLLLILKQWLWNSLCSRAKDNCAHVCVCVCAYKHAHMCKHIHTFTHTHIYIEQIMSFQIERTVLSFAVLKLQWLPSDMFVIIETWLWNLRSEALFVFVQFCFTVFWTDFY